MSVINEMLKDLDERKDGAGKAESQHSRYVVTQQKTNYVMLISVILLTALISVSAMYYMQNSYNNDKVVGEGINTEKSNSEHLVKAPVEKISQGEAVTTELVVSNSQADSNVNNDKHAAQTVVVAKQQVVEEKPAVTQAIKPKIVKTAANSEKDKNEDIAVNASENNVENQQDKEIVAKPKIVKSATKPNVNSSLTISKKQPTPAELAATKLSRAKSALNDGKLPLGESLLEEAIILQPYLFEARQELAALWFGQQRFNHAKNLLRQGIVISPVHAEYRLMLARILATEGKYTQAFRVLNELDDNNAIDYQLALANMAVQSGHHSAAISAYNKLLVMRPDQGRWWLALAISYDSNEQYSGAVSAYKKAIALDQMSKTSTDFALQRLAELGEN